MAHSRQRRNNWNRNLTALACALSVQQFANAAQLHAQAMLSSVQSPLTSAPHEDHMRLGLEAAATLRPAEALEHFSIVVAADSTNLEALVKASMAAVELGEAEKNEKKRAAFYSRALSLARSASRVNPADAQARFQLGLALGVSAVNVGVNERVQYAKEIREQALEALRLQPDHPGALHVLGMWHAELMRISGLKRLVAKTFLGGGFMSEATWEDAMKYMERSAALEPGRLRHHLDLARIYRDRGMIDKSRASYRRVIDSAPSAFNDRMYRDLAEEEMAQLPGSRRTVRKGG